MFCKQRTDAPHLSQLFCFKTEILIDELSFAERSKQFYDRFEIWSNSQKKPEMYAVHVEDKIKRDRCIQLLTEMTNPVCSHFLLVNSGFAFSTGQSTGVTHSALPRHIHLGSVHCHCRLNP